jgi:hypothetical protein
MKLTPFTAMIIAMIFYIICTIAILIHIHQRNVKPISYPEEIQIAKAGDTLIVTSVSDSIYIKFKH